jgi:hypothetical protein
MKAIMLNLKNKQKNYLIFFVNLFKTNILNNNKELLKKKFSSCNKLWKKKIAIMSILFICNMLTVFFNDFICMICLFIKQ